MADSEDHRGPGGERRTATYPTDSRAYTTLQQTIVFDNITDGLRPAELLKVQRYDEFDYGKWKVGPPLPSELRLDTMPPGHFRPDGSKQKRLLRFFAFTDIHITDKESPSQLIYLQQLNEKGSRFTPLYCPVMLYTTHVLDAMVQTANSLHAKDPFDFGISLGDTCNSTQFNELRWYIDVLDGKVIHPSSGDHLGADSIDYQMPYKAAGLHGTIPWYQVMGNHDHFWIGSLLMNDFLRKSYVSDTVIAMGDVLANTANQERRDYYMGVIDGRTPYGDIACAGPAEKFADPPRVVPDPDRRSLARGEWIKEFHHSDTEPRGHGFSLVEPGHENGFACYSFLPRSDVPLKVIALDDTRRDDDGANDIHGHGYLDQERYDWLRKELAKGQSDGHLMIIAAHVPIGVSPHVSQMDWWTDPRNACTLDELTAELHSHPNLLMWISGHRHLNTVKAFISPDANEPERGFWQVETSSLRDFPQQFRTFDVSLNDDLTVSIVVTNVDPAVVQGTPADKSRRYAVATQQIMKNPSIHQRPSALPDATIRPMPTGSYNAELVKCLSKEMRDKMSQLMIKRE